MVDVAGVTAMDFRTAAVTVRVTPGLVIPEEAALIDVVPVATPVAIPVEAIVAAAVFDEAQVTPVVSAWVVESLYVPVAVNCCVFPAAMETPVGVTAMDTRVAAVPVPARVTVCGLPAPV
jgi:hypothetical protein